MLFHLHLLFSTYVDTVWIVLEKHVKLCWYLLCWPYYVRWDGMSLTFEVMYILQFWCNCLFLILHSPTVGPTSKKYCHHTWHAPHTHTCIYIHTCTHAYSHIHIHTHTHTILQEPIIIILLYPHNSHARRYWCIVSNNSVKYNVTQCSRFIPTCIHVINFYT